MNAINDKIKIKDLIEHTVACYSFICFGQGETSGTEWAKMIKNYCDTNEPHNAIAAHIAEKYIAKILYNGCGTKYSIYKSI